MTTKNITTYSIGIGVVDNSRDGLTRLKSAIDREMKAVGDSLTNPIAKASREADLLAKNIEKALSTSGKGFVSQKFLDDLDKAEAKVRSIYTMMAQAVTPGQFERGGGHGVLEKISTIGQGINVARQAAVLSPSAAFAASQQLNPAVTQQQIFGGHVPSRFFSGGGHLDLAPTSITSPVYGTHRRHVMNQDLGMPEGFRPLDLGRQGRFQELAEGRSRFSEVSRSERGAAQLRVSRDLEMQYRKEDEIVNNLAKRYSALSDEERKSLGIRLRAQSAAGRDVTLKQRAFGEANDPWSEFNQNRTGRGSSSHSFRYGAQNAAFAIEDFLISSQYGGAKAGFRAIANNLTAIASAATSSMHPMVGFGAIAATGIISAAAPFAVNAFTGRDEQSEALTQQLVSPRSSIMDRLDASQRSRMGMGAGASAAAQRYQEAQRDIQKFQTQKSEITRSISEETRRLAGESPRVSWTERFLAGAANLGPLGSRWNPMTNIVAGGVTAADWFTRHPYDRRNTRTGEQVRRIDDAQAQLEAANANMRGLGDPTKAIRAAEIARRDFDTELSFQQREFQRENTFNAQRTGIAARQARGELIDPTEAYNIETKSRKIRFNERMNQAVLNEDPARYRMLQQQQIEEQAQADSQLTLSREQFRLSQRDRGYEHEARMAGWEVKPIERMRKQYELQRKRLREDASLTPEMRDAELGALEKSFKRGIRDIGENVGPNMGVEVDSVADAVSRAKFFNRNPTGSEGVRSESEQILRRILEEMQKQTDEMKKKKVPVKNFK